MIPQMSGTGIISFLILFIQTLVIINSHVIFQLLTPDKKIEHINDYYLQGYTYIPSIS